MLWEAVINALKVEDSVLIRNRLGMEDLHEETNHYCMVGAPLAMTQAFGMVSAWRTGNRQGLHQLDHKARDDASNNSIGASPALLALVKRVGVNANRR